MSVSGVFTVWGPGLERTGARTLPWSISRVGDASGDMMARGRDRAGWGAGGTVYSGRVPKVWHSKGVGRGRERRRERRNRKGWESRGRAAESVGRPWGCAWKLTGWEGREMLGTILNRLIRDTGRLGHTARVGGSHGDSMAMFWAEGEAVRSAYFPIEGSEGVWDSTSRGGGGDEMVKTGTDRLQPSLEREELRDCPQGADSRVRADYRCDVMPAVVRDGGQPAVTRDEARHVRGDVEAGQYNSGDSGDSVCDRGRRRRGG